MPVSEHSTGSAHRVILSIAPIDRNACRRLAADVQLLFTACSSCTDVDDRTVVSVIRTGPGGAMSSCKRVVMIAHDNRKNDLLDWAAFNAGTLSRHELSATGTTTSRSGYGEAAARIGQAGRKL